MYYETTLPQRILSMCITGAVDRELEAQFHEASSRNYHSSVLAMAIFDERVHHSSEVN